MSVNMPNEYANQNANRNFNESVNQHANKDANRKKNDSNQYNARFHIQDVMPLAKNNIIRCIDGQANFRYNNPIENESFN